MKPINCNAKSNSTILNLIFCIMIVFFYSCGGGGSGGSSSGTGSVSFGLILQDSDTSRALYSRAADDSAIQFECQTEAYEISTIEAQVFDENGQLLAEGGPWDCEDRQGLIGEVEAGVGRVVKVFARDPEGVILFEGQSDPLTVVAGETTNAGTIVLEPVIFLDSITRVSVDSDGREGNDDSFFPSVSANGRFVAFASNATDLVDADTNDRPDVFVHDLLLETTDLVSLASDGSQGDDDSGILLGEGISGSISINSNGRFVAFVSNATNLVAADTNNAPDVFVHDLRLKTTEMISVASDGTKGDEWSGLGFGFGRGLAISDVGRFVAFESSATNLVANDTNGFVDIFVNDRDADADGIFDEPGGISTVRVSVDSGGNEADDDSHNPAISGNGRFVAFASWATDLVADDSNGSRDIFVHDRDSNENGILDETGGIATVRVSVDSGGNEADDDSFYPDMSGDGRFVVFDSTATNLVAGDSNDETDIFVHDRDADADGIFDEPESISTVRVSVASDGSEGNDRSELPAISGDGRFVVFASLATNLVANDINNAPDIFVHDRDVDADGIFDEPGAIATVRASVASDGSEAEGDSHHSAITSNGQSVAFASDAANLVSDDTNDAVDVFEAPNPFLVP